tara:strand:+ start:948 stop:2675 length:1728 start_codon:yes stop_codon:yes gene_type:complete
MDQILKMVTAREKYISLVVVFFTICATFIEMLSVGAILPMLLLLVDSEKLYNNEIFQKFIDIFGLQSGESLLITFALLILIIFLFKSVFISFLNWFVLDFFNNIRIRLTLSYYKLYLNLPYFLQIQQNSAKMITTTTNVVSVFTNNALKSIYIIFSEIFVLLGISIILFVIEPKGLVVSLLIFSFFGYFFNKYNKGRNKKWGYQRQLNERVRLKNLQEAFGGAKDLKILNKQDEFSKIFHLYDSAIGKLDRNVQFLVQLPRVGVELLLVIIFSLFIIFYSDDQNTRLISLVPTLAIFATAAFRLMPSFIRIISSFQLVNGGLAAINLLSTEKSKIEKSSEIIKKSDYTDKVNFKNNIKFNNVSFKYPNTEKFVHKNLSFEIKHNKITGFIGESGCGKSTLIDLILGLLPPTSGDITVDNTILPLESKSWHSKIGYVSQSINLINDTIGNNIALGVRSEKRNEKYFRNAINLSELEKFINGLPSKEKTIVGEKGINLSGGQNQRIGIARALYRDTDVLILDEATSALDELTENNILERIANLKEKKTIILVSHRPSVTKFCDNLFELKNENIKQIK